MIASSWKKDNDRNASTFFITVHQLHFAKQRKNKCVYASRPGKRTIRACEVFANKRHFTQLSSSSGCRTCNSSVQVFIFTRDMTSIFVAGSVCQSARKSRPYRFGVIATAILKLSLLEGKFSTKNTRSMLTLKIHVYIKC